MMIKGLLKVLITYHPLLLYFNKTDFNSMDYTREEIEQMDPLCTYFESRNQIASKQSEIIGDIDLKSLLSEMGSSGGSKAKTTGSETESQEQEQEQEPVGYY